MKSGGLDANKCEDHSSFAMVNSVLSGILITFNQESREHKYFKLSQSGSPN